MKVKPLEQVMEEANKSWEEGRKGKENIYDPIHKNSYLLGWLQSEYDRMYQFLQKNKNSKPSIV